ncbi:hypothetical protein BYT27DRAFT_7195292, partial [Phlegmacium glaucopus]
MTPCASNSSRMTLTPDTSPASTPKLTTFGSIIASTGSAPSLRLGGPTNPPNTAQHEIQVSMIKPVSIDSVMRNVRAEIGLQESSPSSQQGAHPPINAQSPSPSRVHQMADDVPPAHSGVSQPANFTATLSAPAPFFMMPPSMGHAPLPAVAQSSVKPANPHRPISSSAPTSSSVVPGIFKILV